MAITYICAKLASVFKTHIQKVFARKIKTLSTVYSYCGHNFDKNNVDILKHLLHNRPFASLQEVP
jgi:hypothetical protein